MSSIEVDVFTSSFTINIIDTMLTKQRFQEFFQKNLAS
jgi:hypothetical protein